MPAKKGCGSANRDVEETTVLLSAIEQMYRDLEALIRAMKAPKP